MWKFSANTAWFAQLIATWTSRLMNSWTGGRSIRHLVKPIIKGHHQQLESHGALEMVCGPYKLRYTSMISDGDSSIFKQLHDIKPCGASHVQKRVSMALTDKCKERLVNGRAAIKDAVCAIFYHLQSR